MTERRTIVVATPVPPSVIEHLRAHADVVDVSAQPPASWPAAVGSATGLLVSSATPVDAALLAAAKELRIVATVSVGIDNIALDVLRARGIALTNTRGSLNAAVADLTYGLIIMAQREFAQNIAWVRSGRWMRENPPYSRDLAAATLGILGFGAIGLEVAKRAQLSDMRVIYHNRHPRGDDARTGAAYCSFEELLGRADVLVVLVPLGPQTRGLFDAKAFAAMKKGAVFVNVARGPICDTAALVHALESGHLRGAALDVTDPEPLPPDHPLLARDDVVVVPHIGSATVETRTRMAFLAADNLLAFLHGEPLLEPVAL
ncbi:MAG: D-glycerate dehydrogenase [Vulcanimicrobiaceae bacterium]